MTDDDDDNDDDDDETGKSSVLLAHAVHATSTSPGQWSRDECGLKDASLLGLFIRQG